MKRLLLVVLMTHATGAAAASLSDPTRPYTPEQQAEASAPGFVLQSTLVAPGRKVAVIDGRRLRVGDRHHGAVVTAIMPYEVRLQAGARELRLRLAPKLNDRQGIVE